MDFIEKEAQRDAMPETCAAVADVPPTSNFRSFLSSAPVEETRPQVAVGMLSGLMD